MRFNTSSPSLNTFVNDGQTVVNDGQTADSLILVRSSRFTKFLAPFRKCFGQINHRTVKSITSSRLVLFSFVLCAVFLVDISAQEQSDSATEMSIESPLDGETSEENTAEELSTGNENTPNANNELEKELVPETDESFRREVSDGTEISAQDDITVPVPTPVGQKLQITALVSTAVLLILSGLYVFGRKKSSAPSKNRDSNIRVMRAFCLSNLLCRRFPFAKLNAVFPPVENLDAAPSVVTSDQMHDNECKCAVTESEERTQRHGADTEESCSPSSEQAMPITCVTEKVIIPDRIEMSSEVFKRIRHTIGFRPAETGGILGMSGNGDTFDHFFFDVSPSGASGATYTPNCDAINSRLSDWTENDVTYCGAIHSHPRGCCEPSWADREYAKRLLDNNLTYDKAKPYFYLPIVQSSADPHKFALLSYLAYYKKGKFVIDPIDLYVDGEKYEPAKTCVPLDHFTRISSAIPPAIMRQKTVIAIGAGGARTYLEELARSGVGNFVLMDRDIISASNICTQSVYFSEFDRSKVAVIRERILDINPEANVVCIEKFLDDDLSDEDFLELIGKSCRKTLKDSPTDVLIAGLADNFYANARASRMALKFGTPFIQAGLYPQGSTAEIVFAYPGVTPSCARCATSNRYNTYAEGFVNNATSQGCPIFATGAMNAYKGFISLALLLHGTETRFGTYLKEYATRNFFQVNLDSSGGELFPGEPLGSVHYYEQQPDHPSNGFEECPDCHGTGNLQNMKGKIDDTRQIFKKGDVDSPQEIVALLRQEQEVKGSESKSIGFIP